MRYYYFSINKYQTGSSSEYANNTFNMDNACNHCGTGAIVAGKHKLKGISSGFDKHLFLTNTRDSFISEQLLQKIKEFGCITSSFNSTINQRGQSLPFYHLTSSQTLPKSFTHKGFVQHDGYCKYCKRDNYSRNWRAGDIQNNIPFWAEDVELVYENVDKAFLESADVFNTWECFVRGIMGADGKLKVLAKPSRVVSEKFKDALDDFGIENAEYVPVVFK